MKDFTKLKHKLVLASLPFFLLIAGLACNMPYLASQGTQVEREIAAQLAQDGIPIESVKLEGNTLTITYPVQAIQPLETSLEHVAGMLRSAAPLAERVQTLRVEVKYLEAPYLAFECGAEAARQFAAGQIDTESFLAGLSLQDMRPPERAVRQDLEALGYTIRAVSYTANVLEVSFNQMQFDSLQDLVLSWTPVWQIAYLRAPQASQIVLDIGYANSPDLQVKTGMPVLRDFLENRISSAEFLLNLEMQDIP